ncbi:MAG: AAA family ATPase [Methanothrix sp.]|jgi:DNA repair exonuclease SbcCD ATPase subunit|uniref:AAA family ATPase n=1 Tax=Methanothrix sp. TaxID=90426 RepID=UPI0025D204DE|nr:AAA family ATPase [Methanothrix sp.]MCK9406358.1 AAA family ATPase [Methanothrix sp.]
MILTSVTVKGFRAISQERTVDFSSGLNIIRGDDNEAGKSSLRMAITMALYQDPTTSRDDVLALTSWGRADPWEVSIEFQAESKSYRLRKSLKDKACELVCISECSDPPITKNSAIKSKVAELTGCPSEIFFNSTACIGQDQVITIIPVDLTRSQNLKTKGDITRRLQSTLSGSILCGSKEVNVPFIISRLNEKTNRKDAKGPYMHLQMIDTRLKSLQTEKSNLEIQVVTLMEKRKELDRLKEKVKQMSRDLPPKQELFEKNKSISELEKDIERIKSQYTNFSRARDLRSTLDNLDRDLNRFSAFIQAEQKIVQIKSAQTELKDMEKHLSDLHKDMIILEAQRPSNWLLISGLGLIAAGLVGLIESAYFGALVALGLLFLAYWLASYSACRKNERSITDKIMELDEQALAKGQAQKNLLDSLGFEEYSQCLRQYEEYLSKRDDRQQISDQIKGIIGEKSWAQYRQENAELDVQMSSKLKELEQLKSFKYEPLELQKLELEVIDLKGRLESLEKEKGALEKFLEYTGTDTDNLANIEDELIFLEQERSYWERKNRVFILAREVIEDAHRNTLSKASVALRNELSKYISIITGGRYTEVEIDENDLSIRTRSPENNEMVDVQELSRATKDQFYICARFALVKLITEGKKPPLLLDDPFVNFHPTRLQKMMIMLKELAKENQILLFTLNDAYDDFGNVILLNSPP